MEPSIYKQRDLPYPEQERQAKTSHIFPTGAVVDRCASANYVVSREGEAPAKPTTLSPPWDGILAGERKERRAGVASGSQIFSIFRQFPDINPHVVLRSLNGANCSSPMQDVA